MPATLDRQTIHQPKSRTISLRLNEFEQSEIERYAKFYGKKPSTAIKEAVLQQIEDWEDYIDGINSLKDIADGKVKPLTHEEFWGELGL